MKSSSRHKNVRTKKACWFEKAYFLTHSPEQRSTARVQNSTIFTDEGVNKIQLEVRQHNAVLTQSKCWVCLEYFVHWFEPAATKSNKYFLNSQSLVKLFYQYLCQIKAEQQYIDLCIVTEHKYYIGLNWMEIKSKKKHVELYLRWTNFNIAII